MFSCCPDLLVLMKEAGNLGLVFFVDYGIDEVGFC
jgi:hypothetical protein